MRLTYAEHHHIAVSPLWCCEWFQLYVSKGAAQYLDHCVPPTVASKYFNCNLCTRLATPHIHLIGCIL